MSTRTIAIAAALAAGMLNFSPRASFGQEALAEAFLESAESALHAGNTAKAARLYAAALGEAYSLESTYLTARALVGAAMVHVELGAWEEAEHNVRAALALCEALDEMPREEREAALNCLAIVYCDRGQFEQAEACYVKLLGELESDDDADIARGIVANDLALVKTALGEPEAAIELTHAAAQIMEENFGETSAHYAQCLDTLAQALAANGNLDEARQAIQQSLEICGADIGEKSAQYGASLLTLAKVQGLAGEHATAERTAERSVELQEKTRGATSRMTNLARQELEALRDARSAPGEAGHPTADDGDEALFVEMFSRHDLSPDLLRQRRESWDRLTPDQRRAAAEMFRRSIGARPTSRAPTASRPK